MSDEFLEQDVRYVKGVGEKRADVWAEQQVAHRAHAVLLGLHVGPLLADALDVADVLLKKFVAHSGMEGCTDGCVDDVCALLSSTHLHRPLCVPELALCATRRASFELGRSDCRRSKSRSRT